MIGLMHRPLYTPSRMTSFFLGGAVFLFTLVSPVQAAITIGNKTDTGVLSNSSSSTWSHTVASGDNRTLVVGCVFRDVTTTDTGASGITFNGSNLTKSVENVIYSTNASAYLRSEMWFISNPTVTTANIVATFNGTNSHAGCHAVNLYGIENATIPQDFGSDYETANSISDPDTTVTTVLDGSIAIDEVINLTPVANLTVGAGQTTISNKLGLNANGDSAWASYEIGSSAGDIHMSWSTSGNLDSFTQSTFTLEPYIPPTPTPAPTTAPSMGSQVDFATQSALAMGDTIKENYYFQILILLSLGTIIGLKIYEH